MANDLNEEVRVTVSDADVVTVPIDDTLTNSGEAADAKAVGDALALKADKSELQAAITVNGQAADNQGHIIVTGEDIEVTEDGDTVAAALTEIGSRTAADIHMTSSPTSKTVSEALDDVDSKTAEDIPMGSGALTVAQKMGALDNVGTANSNAISALQTKAGDTIKLEAGGTETILEAVEARVKTINGNAPDSVGNVQVDHAMTADNLTTNQSQTSVGEFVRRAAGGDASIQDGSAWMTNIRGNRTHVGYVPESLNMTVTPVPREEGQEMITATIDRDVFVAYVAGSGTYNIYYTTSWSEDPELYGVTVTGEPQAGDQITIVYVAEDRGTIIQSNPQTFVSTGWNLYNHDVGYAIGIKYSAEYGFMISGTYTAVKYSATQAGTKTTIVPADGFFTIPANGYIWVEGGNTTDTAVYMTWGDWTAGYPGDFQAYTESVIDLSEIMEEYFPYGLLRVGDVRDEIDLNTGLAISNVQRLAYSQENLEAAEATGRKYEYDTNYIYLERATAESSVIELEGQYAVSDHGIEYFTGTDLAVYAIIMYGNNLKNKLERDVLTISQMSLTAAQKTSARGNIAAASEADMTSANAAIAALNSNLTNVDHKNVFTYVVAFNKTQTSQGNWTDGGITFPVSPGDRVTMDVMATGTGQTTRSAIGSSGYVYYNDGPAISDFEHGGRFMAFDVLSNDTSITINSYANSAINVRTAVITVVSKY